MRTIPLLIISTTLPSGMNSAIVALGGSSENLHLIVSVGDRNQVHVPITISWDPVEAETNPADANLVLSHSVWPYLPL